MREILFEYELNPTTWVYLSSLIIIGIYFRFHRFFSVRNLDLLLLIAYAPGLLLVSHGLEQYGYAWLFTISAVFLVRLLLDPLMVRRPLFEPNLSASGLTFTCVALLVFLMTNVITHPVAESDLRGAMRLEDIFHRRVAQGGQSDLAQHGPGYPLFYIFADLSSRAFVPADHTQPEHSRRALLRAVTIRVTAIFAHLAVIAGMLLIGYRHFDNLKTGVAAASLYLLLPYSAQMTGRVDHVSPAALLVWAIAAYRRPFYAGVCVGLAAGVIYYPLFLLPLWCSFYWRRGLIRFLIGVGLVLLLLAASLAFTSSNMLSFVEQLKQMFGWTSLSLANADGFWESHESTYRIPVMAAFLALSCSLALWPAHKNLGTLLSCSAAVMVGTQFWHAYQGGIYMAWYMPLLVLTVFRPNLEDRMALTTVRDVRFTSWQDSWFAKMWHKATGKAAVA
jgi:hypothetical protein